MAEELEGIPPGIKEGCPSGFMESPGEDIDMAPGVPIPFGIIAPGGKAWLGESIYGPGRNAIAESQIFVSIETHVVLLVSWPQVREQKK